MIENILQYATTLNVVSALCIFYVIFGIIAHYNEDRKIRATKGSRAAFRTQHLPFGIDMIWETIQHARVNKNMEFWQKSFKKYGNPNAPYTMEANPGGRRVVLTAEPENIKAILATQFSDYGKGEQFNKEWHEFLGDSIFTTDGQQWHGSRQLLRPQFIKDRVSDLDTFEKHVNVMLPMIKGQGQTIDIADLFFRYTLDAATDFLLGKSVDSLENPGEKFGEAFNHVQHVQGMIARSGPFNWMIPRGTFRDGLKIINTFINTFIERTLRISPEELIKKTKSEEGYTFLHALGAYTQDRTVLRDQLIAVLLAGRDTTACTLSWCFYELSTHPDIFRKLRQEILDRVGTSRAPTYDDLKSMKYLTHTLNETLRLYPVVPFNVRLALRDTTLPTGGGADGKQPIGILSGTPIGYSTLVMQRRPDLYPSEAEGFPPVEAFVPERWDNWTPKSWTYIPFNGGPRICIGQQFALTEMAYTVVRMLQKFDKLESRMGGQQPGLQSDIVLMPANGVKVAFWQGKD